MHAAGDVAPVAALYDPAAQDSHDDAPAIDAYVPAPQIGHANEPIDALDDPGSQG